MFNFILCHFNIHDDLCAYKKMALDWIVLGGLIQADEFPTPRLRGSHFSGKVMFKERNTAFFSILKKNTYGNTCIVW